PPSARICAGTRSSAMTATAPAFSAISACFASVTSMMTPPLSISANPVFKRRLVACPLFELPLFFAIFCLFATEIRARRGKIDLRVLRLKLILDWYSRNSHLHYMEHTTSDGPRSHIAAAQPPSSTPRGQPLSLALRGVARRYS